MNRLGPRTLSKREDDNNPKTLPLEELVQRIEPRLLSYYLGQIALYLKNTKRDLWFPLISPELDAFLVRMLKDEQNLLGLLHLLDEKSNAFAVEILEVLKENKQVFKLFYTYESSLPNKNTLVYKKVFVKKPVDPVFNDQSLNPEWLNATLQFVNEIDIDNLEYPDMSIDEAELVACCLRLDESPVDDMYVGQLPSLRDALKAARDKYLFRISYIHLSSDTVRLLVEKVPLNNNKVHENVCSRDPSTDTEAELTKSQKNFLKKKELVESLEPLFARTALKMILDFINNETEASIVFKNANENQSTFLQCACSVSKWRKASSLLDDESQTLMKKIGKALAAGQVFDLKIDVAKMERETKLRTVSIIKHPRESAQRHSEPDSEEPVRSRPTKPTGSSLRQSSGSRGLSNWEYQNQPSTSSYQQPSTSKPLEDSCAGPSYIDRPQQQASLNTGTSTQTIDKTASVKTTDYKNKIEEAKALTNVQAIHDAIAKTICYTKTLIGSKDVEDIKARAIEQAMSIDPSKMKPTDKIKTIDSGRNREKALASKGAPAAVASTSASAIDKEKGAKDKVESKVPTEQSDGRPLPPRKAKLLEAMSVPVESDKAMRMMRQMGWDGGPLGVRGEGITEPIVPALHITSGAGLGHVKPKKEAPAKSKNFRLEIVKNILQLIKEEPLKKNVIYPNQISKKERGFVLNTVKAFTKRRTMKMNDEELQDMVKLVMEEMVKEPTLEITVVLHEDMTSITFSKNDVQCINRTGRPSVPLPQPPAESVLTIVLKHARSNLVTSDIITQVGRELMPTLALKSAKSLGHRVVLLAKIRELLKGNRYETMLKFDYTLTMKHMNHVNQMVTSFNYRGKLSYSTAFENHLANETLKVVGDSYLVHEFGNTNESLKIRKKSYTNQHAPEKPKPKELSRAIINNNNSAETINKNNKPVVTKENGSGMEFVVTKIDTKEPAVTETNDPANNDTIDPVIDVIVPKENNEVSDAKCADEVVVNENNKFVDSTKDTIEKDSDIPKENEKSFVANDNEIIVRNDNEIVDVTNEGKSEDDEIDSKVTEKGDSTEKSDGKTDDTDTVSSISTDSDIYIDSTDIDGKVIEQGNEAKDVIDNGDVALDYILEDIVNKEFEDFANGDREDVKVETDSQNDENVDDSNRNRDFYKQLETPKYVCIAPESYPIEEIDIKMAQDFQSKILYKLQWNDEKALIECAGIKNGSLIYGCHNAFGMQIVHSVASEMNLKTTNITNLYNRTRYKVIAKLNSYLDVEIKELFKILEDYNDGLKTDSWKVSNVKMNSENLVMNVEIDAISFDYLSNNGFGLFAGMDKVKFCVEWN